jgi:hypothetical protein
VAAAPFGFQSIRVRRGLQGMFDEPPRSSRSVANVGMLVRPVTKAGARETQGAPRPANLFSHNDQGASRSKSADAHAGSPRIGWGGRIADRLDAVICTVAVSCRAGSRPNMLRNVSAMAKRTITPYDGTGRDPPPQPLVGSERDRRFQQENQYDALRKTPPCRRLLSATTKAGGTTRTELVAQVVCRPGVVGPASVRVRRSTAESRPGVAAASFRGHQFRT